MHVYNGACSYIFVHFFWMYLLFCMFIYMHKTCMYAHIHSFRYVYIDPHTKYICVQRRILDFCVWTHINLACVVIRIFSPPKIHVYIYVSTIRMKHLHIMKIWINFCNVYDVYTYHACLNVVCMKCCHICVMCIHTHISIRIHITIFTYDLFLHMTYSYT